MLHFDGALLPPLLLLALTLPLRWRVREAAYAVLPCVC